MIQLTGTLFLSICSLLLHANSWQISGKIEALVSKTLGVGELRIEAIDKEKWSISATSGQFDILSLNKIFVVDKPYGFVVEARAYSCREGGCPDDPLQSSNSDSIQGYEYFDFFVILDSTFTIVRVQITNYQATKGHEIMSRSFLRQFIGKSPSRTPSFGRNIDGISGATISGIAITSTISSIIDMISATFGDS